MIGIYGIFNISNNCIYVGQSSNVHYRLRKHKEMLKRNVHFNEQMQEDWNICGEKIFCFDVLEVIDDKKHLDEKEIFWTEYYKNNTSCNVYNINIGRKLSESTKEKLRQANLGDNNPKYWLGKHRSEEQKQKQSKAMKGKMAGENHPMWGKEGCWKGKTRPEEFGKKISEALKGHAVSDESKRKMSEAKKGRESPKKFPLTQELFEDIKNGLSYNDFVLKYGNSKNTLYRIKKELKAKGLI